MDEQQSLLDELRASAKPLIEICNPEVVQRINESVQVAATTWQETNDNLHDLKDKYHRAVELWQKYRESSEGIKNWADDQMNTIGMSQPPDANGIQVNKLLLLFFNVTVMNIFHKNSPKPSTQRLNESCVLTFYTYVFYFNNTLFK